MYPNKIIIYGKRKYGLYDDRIYISFIVLHIKFIFETGNDGRHRVFMNVEYITLVLMESLHVKDWR